MRSRTLTNLIADVRRVADIEGATARHPDTNITRELNQSIQAFRLLVSGWCDYYVVSDITLLTLLAGSNRASGAGLNSIVRVYGLDVLVQGQYQEMAPFSLAERNRYGAESGVPMYWREAASSSTARSLDIICMPKADADYVLRPWYLPAFTDLVAGADIFDGMIGWEDWPIYDASIRCATRDAGVNDNYEILTNELARIEARIQREARSLRLPGVTKRIDTQGRRQAIDSLSGTWWK